MSKKKKIIIAIIALIIVLSASLAITKALYKSAETGQASVSVAGAKIRIINEATYVEELDFETYSNEFQIVNYDEENNVSEVGLDYTLFFDTTDENAPIGMRLYKIAEDGTETEIELNEDLETISKFTFEAGKKQEDKFRLEMYFNLETGKMDENTKVNINLKSVQTKPEK